MDGRVGVAGALYRKVRSPFSSNIQSQFLLLTLVHTITYSGKKRRKVKKESKRHKKENPVAIFVMSIK